ncbi:MAG: PEP-CTERM sorting domain-containing protein [Tepidisphaeraceae bacterium]
MAWIPGIASATVYIGNNAYAGGGNQAAAITNVVMTNDATNLYVTMNFDTAGATLNQYLNYEIGFQDNGPGSGQTAVSNPYGEPIGISTGMYDWASAFAYPTPPTNSGADFYHYNGATLASDGTLATSFSNATGASWISMTIPLADLGSSGLVAGNTFNFDCWTTYGGSPQGPYGVLDNNNSNPVPNEIWNSQPWNGAPYDSATDPDTTFASTTYTVTAVPEPASLGLLCLSGVTLLLRRRSAR